VALKLSKQIQQQQNAAFRSFFSPSMRFSISAREMSNRNAEQLVTKIRMYNRARQSAFDPLCRAFCEHADYTDGGTSALRRQTQFVLLQWAWN
jgi:hypothetical protein